MIKQLGKHDTLMSPFLTVKGWSLSNTDPQELLLTENTGSEELVALEYMDYTLGDTGSLNRECNIALEQQSTDLAVSEEGISGSGKFFPDSEPINQKTGHFKRLVHDQTHRAFYNRYNNPLQIFGIDNIDFPLAHNNRYLADKFLMFTIPRMIFGERITENTVVLYDQNFDDNIIINDDGSGNLVAKKNLFSKIQEVRDFGNFIFTGSVLVCGVTGSIPSGSIELIVTSGSAVLDWTDPFGDEDGFIVQKSFDGVTYDSYATTSADVSYYVDSNVTESNSYWYRVYAFNQWGSSSYSNTASIEFTSSFPCTGFYGPENMEWSVYYLNSGVPSASLFGEATGSSGSFSLVSATLNNASIDCTSSICNPTTSSFDLTISSSYVVTMASITGSTVEVLLQIGGPSDSAYMLYTYPSSSGTFSASFSITRTIPSQSAGTQVRAYIVGIGSDAVGTFTIHTGSMSVPIAPSNLSLTSSL